MNHEQFISRILLIGWIPIGHGIYGIEFQRLIVDEHSVIMYWPNEDKNKLPDKEYTDFEEAIQAIIKNDTRRL